jgi:hypothetical protein
MTTTSASLSAARPCDAASGFPGALHAAGPAPGLGEAANVYGWLVGSWDVRAVDHLPDGTRLERAGEWHFAWVLDGWAVQDVFIVPTRRVQRETGAAGPRVRYGTTLRLYDSATGAWRITWYNPSSGVEARLAGRRAAGAVVQEGWMDDGTAMRWSFVDVAANAFTWRGETSADAGRTWRLDAEFFCRRAPFESAGRAADDARPGCGPGVGG